MHATTARPGQPPRPPLRLALAVIGLALALILFCAARHARPAAPAGGPAPGRSRRPAGRAARPRSICSSPRSGARRLCCSDCRWPAGPLPGRRDRLAPLGGLSLDRGALPGAGDPRGQSGVAQRSPASTTPAPRHSPTARAARAARRRAGSEAPTLPPTFQLWRAARPGPDRHQPAADRWASIATDRPVL